MQTAFGCIVFMYVAYDYLNSPHAWIESRWNPGLLKNLVEMARRGFLQSGSIVELPFTDAIKSWIDSDDEVRLIVPRTLYIY